MSKKTKGILFIISAPSGTGKTTLVEMLLEEFSDVIVKVITYTTRKPREDERQGVDYYFVTEEEFRNKQEAGEFLEHVKIFDYYYGTMKEDVERVLQEGRHALLIIDTEGALRVKQRIQNSVLIFISPPDLQELQKRLDKRNTESLKDIQKRLEKAEREIKKICYYDYHFINENLQHAYQILRSIILAEEHKIISMRCL